MIGPTAPDRGAAPPIATVPSPAGTPPPPHRRKLWVMVAAVVVAVVVVVGVLTFAGVFKTSSSSSNATGMPTPFSSAAPLAVPSAQGASGGPWTIVAAEGVGVPSEVSQTNISSIGTGGCAFTVVSGGSTEVSIPATPSSATPGELSVWVFFAKNPSLSSILMIAVVDGQAKPLALVTGCSAVSDFAQLGMITASAVVDSTAVASDFNQNGGSAFLTSETLGSQLFLLLGGFSGTDNAPVWDVMYSTCGVASPSGPGTWLSGYYFATNGTAVTAPAQTSGTCS
jgi:hypothetical protein